MNESSTWGLGGGAASRPAWPAALFATRAGAWRAGADGVAEELTPAQGLRAAQSAAHILLHRPATAAMMGRRLQFPAYDLLELFAFVRPAQFLLPTPGGLAQALDLPRPSTPAATPAFFHQAARRLLADMERWDERALKLARAQATGLAEAQWPWAAFVLDAITVRLGPDDGARLGFARGVDVWRRLPEWQDNAAPPPPGHEPVAPDASEARLIALRGRAAEDRPEQRRFARQATAAFAPREEAGEPQIALVEAGTGTGKTLGYLAPASLWAEENGAPVWVSTYTRNLQRQIDQEAARLFPDEATRARKIVIRKGRENYLCLLNLEEAWAGGAAQGVDRASLILMARWAGATRDGDLNGGDFPDWLGDLFGAGRTLGLADRRGECIHNACPHYRVCFIERTIRRAKTADLVIANHALVMTQAAANPDRQILPVRYVFDEGHHLFDAADSAFGADLSGAEAYELRRWIRGPEGARRGRGRGLEKRIGDVAAADEDFAQALAALIDGARVLPRPGWDARIMGRGNAADWDADPAPLGPLEKLLADILRLTRARGADDARGYDMECEPHPIPDELRRAARSAHGDLMTLVSAMEKLGQAMGRALDRHADDWPTDMRNRVTAAQAGVDRRLQTARAWAAMASDLADGVRDERFVDGFRLERQDGRDQDILFFRRWRDPMKPFVETVLKPAFGALICSATLRDRHEGDGDGWSFAEARTGMDHLILPPQRLSVSSPFDYARNTRVLILRDVQKNDMDQLAAAYRALIIAAGGGALGLFTAIARLRAVHQRIAPALDDAGIPLYAQHVDAIGNAALVDMFRAEENSCLLGTDAMRDGVDVPGRSLRMVLFDRMPWPRADILHKARREVFGGPAYDDALTRLRLKQAFGRLVRRADDRGLFILMDAAAPTRLMSAFPDGVRPERVGLADAVAAVKSFLNS